MYSTPPINQIVLSSNLNKFSFTICCGSQLWQQRSSTWKWNKTFDYTLILDLNRMVQGFSRFTIAEIREACTLFWHGCRRQNLNLLFLYMANMSGVECVPNNIHMKCWNVLMTCWQNAFTHWRLWDTEFYLEHQLRNCSQVNARELRMGS